MSRAERNPGPRGVAALPLVFSGLRALEIDVAEFVSQREEGLDDVLLAPLAHLPHLEALAVYNAHSIGRAGVEKLLRGLLGVQRFTIAFCSQRCAADVTSRWLAALLRSLRPRLVQCTLLHPGVRWGDW